MTDKRLSCQSCGKLVLLDYDDYVELQYSDEDYDCPECARENWIREMMLDPFTYLSSGL